MKMTLLAALATLTLGMGAAFAQTSFYHGPRHGQTGPGQGSYQYDTPGG